jgi:hypothetical protein
MKHLDADHLGSLKNRWLCRADHAGALPLARLIHEAAAPGSFGGDLTLVA